MRNYSYALLAFALLRYGTVVQADNWPQWRGPQRDGISQERGLLQDWPKEGPKLLWQVHGIGDGYSTPSVVDESIYLLGNDGLEDEFVQALAVKDGQNHWQTRLGKVGNPKQQPTYPAARSTPTVDGKFLYALGSDGDLACLDIANGQARWHKNLRSDFDGQPGLWAYSESPLVDGNALICTPGGHTATLLALNKVTGEVIWKSSLPGSDQAAYASAITVEAGGVKQYVQFVQKGLVGVDAKTGKLLWRYDRTAKGSMANIPTPVADGALIYSSTGRGGAGLMKVKANSGSFEAEELYFNPKLPKAIGGAIKIGKYLYGTTGQGLICSDFASGEIKWESPSIAPASLCYADGRLYLHGEKGEVALVETTADGYLEKGRFAPPNQPNRGQSEAWAYPIVANGRLYIRDLGRLWCYDISKPN